MGWMIGAIVVLLVTNAFTAYRWKKQRDAYLHLDDLLFDNEEDRHELYEVKRQLAMTECWYRDLKYHWMLRMEAEALARMADEVCDQTHYERADVLLKTCKSTGYNEWAARRDPIIEPIM